ncbi:MAG: hypothetical protein JSS95_12130 [Acidobacteria bacterium]|nr:hypothetical protein [Acidobacteriota bacterium]
MLISQTVSATESVESLSVPEFGFYDKYVSCGGVTFRSSKHTKDHELSGLCVRLDRMLAKQDDARRNMAQRGVEFHVVAADEQVASLPEYRGVGRDGRALDVGVYGSCVESKQGGSDGSCSRQLAISIFLFGFDEQMRRHIEEQFRSARLKGLWRDDAAGESAKEYWAQLSVRYFGWGRATAVELRAYDPGGYALLDHIYGGFERPRAIEVIRARSVSKLAISKVNKVPAQIQLVNNSARPIRVFWMDTEGKSREVGELGPFNRTIRDTSLSQVWIVEDERGVEMDRFIVEDPVSEYIAAD